MALSFRNILRSNAAIEQRKKQAFSSQVLISPENAPNNNSAQPTASITQLRKFHRTPDEWQREVWDFLDSVGEFRQGINWKANMLSRVRLRAAKLIPGQDEPEIINDGPAADLVAELAGGVGGQSELMSAFVTYLDVPGECYLVGEEIPNEPNKWYLRSIEELQPTQIKDSNGNFVPGYKVAEGNGHWRELPYESYVVRVWRPHRRWHNVADSPAKAARTLLRELELLNRHLQAQYLSRLASCGILVLPEEITFPVREEFKDAADPFMEEWMEIATEAIQTPGSAAAVVPIPIRMPAEYIDKIQHIDFTLKLDDNIIQKRDSALTRLAIQLDMPPEALTGVRDVNHWNAWLIDEHGIKVHVAPEAELICAALTDVYLVPMLKAQNIDPTGLVIWYDASELILRPDKTTGATAAYDNFELSGKAFRRETGFDESDKPTTEDLKHMALVQMIKQAPNAFAAYSLLTGEDISTIMPAPTGTGGPNPDDNRSQDNNGMETDKNPPNESDSEGAPVTKKPNANEVAIRNFEQQLVYQAKLSHAVKVNSFDRSYEIYHPKDCQEHLFSCPFTYETWRKVPIMPGMGGIYKLTIDHVGHIIVGKHSPEIDVSTMIKSTHFNGKAKKLINGI